MKCIIKWSLFCAFVFIHSPSLLGQSMDKVRKQTWPISISISNQSWAFPLSNIGRLSPFYPGITVGSSYYYIKKERSHLYQTGEGGGFINQNSGSAFYLNSNLVYRYKAPFGLAGDLGLGLGYFHSYHRSKTFRQQEDGSFAEVSDLGVPASSANILLGFGYDLSRISNIKAQPFIRYQWIASTRYWSAIGIRPSGLLHLGIQVNIK